MKVHHIPAYYINKDNLISPDEGTLVIISRVVWYIS